MSSIDYPLITSIFAAIATALAALATYRAPIQAAEFAERLRSSAAEAAERKRLRTVIFFTLMQERATISSVQSVQMLNAIDAVFNDCSAVREAWADLYHTFSLKDAAHIIDEKHRELLRQMAIDLGLASSLKRDDFSRTYYPNALAEEHYVETLRRITDKERLQKLSNPSENSAPAFTQPASPSPFPPRPA